jgi:hypothetical protein
MKNYDGPGVIGITAGSDKPDSSQSGGEQVVRRIVELYQADPLRVANICDRQLDPTGNLLGYIRDVARSHPMVQPEAD